MDDFMLQKMAQEAVLISKLQVAAMFSIAVGLLWVGFALIVGRKR
jgi:hypothetical protein